MTDEELERIYNWADENEGRFIGMTYLEGIKAMVDLLQGNMTIEELLE
jgi:hypothetical protein